MGSVELLVCAASRQQKRLGILHCLQKLLKVFDQKSDTQMPLQVIKFQAQIQKSDTQLPLQIVKIWAQIQEVVGDGGGSPLSPACHRVDISTWPLCSLHLSVTLNSHFSCNGVSRASCACCVTAAKKTWDSTLPAEVVESVRPKKRHSNATAGYKIPSTNPNPPDGE